MHAINIGKGTKNQRFNLPIDLVTQTVAILARKGKGKSYLAAVIAEELLDAEQLPVIIDPTGAHWGLKSSADGNAEGYKVVIFGGEHADVPLEDTAGEVVARAIVEHRFPAVIDLSLFGKNSIHRFMASFLEKLYLLNREPLCLLCDEADLYAPQTFKGDTARVVGAMEDIVRRGRIRGIGCIMVTQRPASLNKNVLTQAEMLVTLGMNHPRDIEPINEWVATHADEKEASVMIKDLPTMPAGTAWFWAPGWGDIFEKVEIRARKTFDSGKTPKAGEKIRAPKHRAAVDVDLLGKEIAATVQRVKENDPQRLKSEIARLQAELAKKDKAPLIQVDPKWFDRPIMGNEDRRQMRDLAEMFDAAQRGFVDLFEKLQRKIDSFNLPAPAAKPIRTTPPPVARPARKVEPGGISGTLTGTQQKILDVVAMLGIRQIAPTRETVARWLDIHPNGGRYGTDLAALRAQGYLDNMTLTATGQAEARPMETGFEAAKLTLTGTQRLIVDTLKDQNDRISRERLAELLGIHPNGGRFGTDLARLRTMGIIPERGEIYLSTATFQ